MKLSLVYHNFIANYVGMCSMYCAWCQVVIYECTIQVFCMDCVADDNIKTHIPYAHAWIQYYIPLSGSSTVRVESVSHHSLPLISTLPSLR